jgi:hypothetical protein
MADILLTGEGQRDEPSRRLRPLASLAAAVAAEGERRVLWLPVWFGSGIATTGRAAVAYPRWWAWSSIPNAALWVCT